MSSECHQKRTGGGDGGGAAGEALNGGHAAEGAQTGHHRGGRRCGAILVPPLRLQTSMQTLIV